MVESCRSRREVILNKASLLFITENFVERMTDTLTGFLGPSLAGIVKRNIFFNNKKKERKSGRRQANTNGACRVVDRFDNSLIYQSLSQDGLFLLGYR